ncbi:DUF2304 domain-containing protein [Streptomyces sp. SID13666]|uniref:DUF2304 domain-containing protein n=1 Tax=unclassified Streptomyces TaxID=2593676 RepID=UPI0013BFA29F|nr:MULTISPECIES: DUF2304 domain-containing protein [unclassified Streptomyces]NEA55332.1 DUF2304 domain-containing protein [Streptomyces sp. SID13666]NEA73538.1 DUF2304 domain-containing protein [Streptomyces sp. SID13588]
MALNISLLLVLLTVVVVLIRQKVIKVVPALICAVMGFEAATSRAGPSIAQGITSVVGMIGRIHI